MRVLSFRSWEEGPAPFIYEQLLVTLTHESPVYLQW